MRSPENAEELAELRRWIAALFEAGYYGADWPVEFGGEAEHDPRRDVVVAEEVARARAPMHFGGNALAASALIRFGSGGQQDRLLPAIRSCDDLWCQLFSEPDAGSDLGGMRTRAVADGDGYVVTGQKVWTTNGHWADRGYLLARTDPDVPKHKGITAFAIDMDTPGIDVRPLRELTGTSDFNEVFFDGVRIPATAVIGTPGQGWIVANASLAEERNGVSAAVVDLQLAWEDLYALAQKIEIDGRSALEQADVRQRFGALRAEIRACALLGQSSFARWRARPGTGDRRPSGEAVVQRAQPAVERVRRGPARRARHPHRGRHRRRRRRPLAGRLPLRPRVHDRRRQLGDHAQPHRRTRPRPAPLARQPADPPARRPASRPHRSRKDPPDMLLSDEQVSLAEAARDWLAQRTDLAAARADGAALAALYSADDVRAAAELGLTSLLRPAEGGTFADLAVVVEELGRAGSPLPLGQAALVARLLDQIGIGAAVSDAVADGSALVVPAAAEPDDAAIAGVPAADGTLALAGRAAIVVGGLGAAWLLVSAAIGDDRALALVPAASAARTARTARTTLDLSRDIAAVYLHGVTIPAGDWTRVGADVAETLDQALAIIHTLDAVGAAGRLLDMTVGYVKEREQFGRPVGSFQAVKHQAATMAVDIEASRFCGHDAARALDGGDLVCARHGCRGRRLRGRGGDQPRGQHGTAAPRRHGLHLGARPAPVPAPDQGRRAGPRHAPPAPRAPVRHRRLTVGGGGAPPPVRSAATGERSS